MEDTKPEKSYEFQHYCCAVIDLLGQSNLLESLDALPKGDGEYETYVAAARGTVGGVLNVRKQIETFYSSLIAKATPSWMGSLTPEQQEQFKRLRTVSLTIQQF